MEDLMQLPLESAPSQLKLNEVLHNVRDVGVSARYNFPTNISLVQLNQLIQLFLKNKKVLFYFDILCLR